MTLRVGDQAPDFSLPPAPGPDLVTLTGVTERATILELVEYFYRLYEASKP